MGMYLLSWAERVSHDDEQFNTAGAEPLLFAAQDQGPEPSILSVPDMGVEHHDVAGRGPEAGGFGTDDHPRSHQKAPSATSSLHIRAMATR